MDSLEAKAARDISEEEQKIKKLHAGSKSTPFGTRWTKLETYNPINVGGDPF